MATTSSDNWDTKEDSKPMLNTVTGTPNDSVSIKNLRESFVDDVFVLKGKWTFIIMFALLQTAIGFQLGYIFCYTNQITPALNAKYGWP